MNLLRKKVCGKKGQRSVCCPDVLGAGEEEVQPFQLDEQGNIPCELHSDCPAHTVATSYSVLDLPDIEACYTGRRRRDTEDTEDTFKTFLDSNPCGSRLQERDSFEGRRNFSSVTQYQYITYKCQQNLCQETLEDYCETLGKSNPECQRCSVTSPPPFPPCFSFQSVVAPQTQCGPPLINATWYHDCVHCDTYLPGGHFAHGQEGCVKFSANGSPLSRGAIVTGISALQIRSLVTRNGRVGSGSGGGGCPRSFCRPRRSRGRGQKCCLLRGGGWGGRLALCPHSC